jgi:hypothetical protein
MPRKEKPRFTKENKWSEISRRFCRFHGLPHGSALKVVYDASPRFPKGRVQRDNTVYQRAVFKKGTLERAADDKRIRKLIDEDLVPYIDIDLKASGVDIKAFGPSGEGLDSRTTVGTWRSLPSAPTEEEIEEVNAQLAQIEEVAKEARPYLNNLSEFHWTPEDVVPQGVIRAMVSMFGIDAVRQAVQAEFGGKNGR